MGRTYFALKPPAPSLAGAIFTQLTSDPGEELFPSISPNGKTVAYARSRDIYLLRVGGKNAVNLTHDASGNTEPAFSPDGEQIAFHSDREGGGLFLMGATGESVRRVTELGHSPSWSPDGKQIVFATEGVGDPDARQLATSRAWVVELPAGGYRRNS